MATSVKNKDKKTIVFYINIVICLSFMFLFRYLPPFGPVTPMGMHVLGIFISTLYGWSTINLLWPGLFSILALGMVEGNTMTGVVAAGLGSQTTWLIFFMFIFVTCFEKNGGSKFVASWFISRKLLKGRPLLFSFFFFLGAFFLGMMNSFASIIFFWGVLYQICAKFGYKPYEKYSVFMVMGSVLFAVFGSISHSLKGSVLILSGAYTSATGSTITMIEFVKCMVPLGLFLIVVYLFLMKFIFRVSFEKIQQIDLDSLIDKNDLVISKQLKWTFFYLALLVVLLMGSGVVPKSTALYKFLTDIGLFGAAVIVVGAMMVTRVDGRPLLDFTAMVRQGVQWDVLFICATILPLSSLLTAQNTGIGALFVNIFNAVIGNASPYMFVVLALLIAFILTNFGNNVSIAILLLPGIFSIATSLGLDPKPIYIALVAATHFAFLTPGACPYAGLLFGNTEWISMKQIYQYMPIILGVFYILLITLGYSWFKFIL